jgi:hypothetical protein
MITKALYTYTILFLRQEQSLRDHALAGAWERDNSDKTGTRRDHAGLAAFGERDGPEPLSWIG